VIQNLTVAQFIGLHSKRQSERGCMLSGVTWRHTILVRRVCGSELVTDVRECDLSGAFSDE